MRLFETFIILTPRRIHAVPIYAKWRDPMAKPVTAATRNSLRPYCKCSCKIYTNDDLFVTAAAVILVYRTRHILRNRRFWVGTYEPL